MQLNEAESFLLQLDEWLDKYGDMPTEEVLKIEKDFIKKLVSGIISCLEYKDDTYIKRLEKYI